MKAQDGLLALFLAAILSLLPSLQGCSLVGFGIGSAVDGGKPDITTVGSWGIDTVKVGEIVTVHLKDGSRLNGKYGGIEVDSLDQYRARYEEYYARRQGEWRTPRVGDSVSFTLKSETRSNVGRRFRRQFAGYGYKAIHFQSSPTATTPSPYSWIDTLWSEEVPITGDRLRWAVATEDVPLLEHIVLVGYPTADQRRSVSLSAVDHISYKTSKNAALTGFLIGLAVDAVIVVVVLINAQEDEPAPAPPPPPPTTGQGSCPFAYSFDGQRYVLDSETFSGAICRALKRTDWDNLDHLVDVDGVCSLRVENRLPETQYIDAMRLHVVEHPAGSTVIADDSGVMHVLGKAEEPEEAIDLSGSVVTALVRASDSLAWVSNPVRVSPDGGGSVRDGLILTFERPRDAGSGRLILNLRNSLWSTEVEERLLRLQGSYLDRWYDAMNESPEFRNSFVEVVQREAMLNVQLWTGETWTTVRYIPFPGPYVDKAVVVPLDLREVSSPDLRVRVESTVGLWVINSVAIDFTAPEQASATEAAVVRALDTRGIDVRRLLSTDDDEYQVLSPGDRLQLAFSVPPPGQGRSRTYVLESAGYYTTHVSPSGAPQRALMDSFTREPGAFGRYTLRIFHSWLDRELGEGE